MSGFLASDCIHWCTQVKIGALSWKPSRLSHLYTLVAFLRHTCYNHKVDKFSECHQLKAYPSAPPLLHLYLYSQLSDVSKLAISQNYSHHSAWPTESHSLLDTERAHLELGQSSPHSLIYRLSHILRRYFRNWPKNRYHFWGKTRYF